MSQGIPIQKRQDEIYQKMSARRKLAILDMFYQTGRKLANLNKNERKYSNRLEDAQTVLDVTPVSKNLIKSWALKLNLTDEYDKLKFEN